MAFIKNDVTDQELEDLFDKDDNSKFQKTKKDNLISDELDVKNESSGKINRPDEYVKTPKREITSQAKELVNKVFDKLKNKEDISHINGNVTSDVFKAVAKARQEAMLEEYKLRQAKIPKIQPDAKIKLECGSSCEHHTYIPYQMTDGNHIMVTCKYCSDCKIFDLNTWMKYQLENKQYM